MPRPVPPDGKKDTRFAWPVSPSGKARYERMCKIMGVIPSEYGREVIVMPLVEAFEATHALEVAEFERNNPPIVR